MGAATNALMVEPNPDAADVPQLHPPRPEIPPGFWEECGPWAAVGIVLALAVLSAVVWYLLKGRPPVPEPPERKARELLSGLREAPEDGKVLSQVSQALRHYMAAVLAFGPGELTTAEFCLAVDGHQMLGPEFSKEICGFLRLCDERKFSPTVSDSPLGAVAQALKIVDGTEERIARFREQEQARSDKPAR
jgi:hypothetical protein